MYHILYAEVCVCVCVSDELPLNSQTTLQGYFYSFLCFPLLDGGLSSFITKRLFLLSQNESWLFCVFCLWIEQDSLNDPLLEHGPFTVQIICQKRPALTLTLKATTSEGNAGRKRRKKRWTEDHIIDDREKERERENQTSSSQWYIHLPVSRFVSLTLLTFLKRNLCSRNTFSTVTKKQARTCAHTHRQHWSLFF